MCVGGGRGGARALFLNVVHIRVMYGGGKLGFCLVFIYLNMKYCIRGTCCRHPGAPCTIDPLQTAGQYTYYRLGAVAVTSRVVIDLWPGNHCLGGERLAGSSTPRSVGHCTILDVSLKGHPLELGLTLPKAVDRGRATS